MQLFYFQIILSEIALDFILKKLFKQKYPPKKGYVRGVSFLTANYIRANSPKSSTFFYVTQADPGI